MDRPLFFEFSGFRFLEELKTRSLFFFSGEPFGSFTGLKIPQKKEKKRRRRTVVRSIPDLPSMEPTAAFPTDLWCCARPVPYGPRGARAGLPRNSVPISSSSSRGTSRRFDRMSGSFGEVESRSFKNYRCATCDGSARLAVHRPSSVYTRARPLSRRVRAHTQENKNKNKNKT